MSTFYNGDNLDIVKRYREDERVDLVYLDPSRTSTKTKTSFPIMNGYHFHQCSEPKAENALRSSLSQG